MSLRSVMCLFGSVFAMIAMAGSGAVAQEKPPAEPRVAATPLKVTVVISRFQGEKKTGSLPFTVTLNTGQRTSLRMGTEVPVPQPTIAKDQVISSYSYRPVGTSIDCSAGQLEGDGRFSIQLTVSDTQVSMDTSPEISATRGLPRFQTFTSTATLMLRDGQSMQYTAATDKTTGEVVKLDVTLNIVK